MHAGMYTKKRWGMKWRTAKRGGNKGNQSQRMGQRRKKMCRWEGGMVEKMLRRAKSRRDVEHGGESVSMCIYHLVVSYFCSNYTDSHMK